MDFFKSFKKRTGSNSSDGTGLGIRIPKARSKKVTFGYIIEKLSMFSMKFRACGDTFQHTPSLRTESIPFFYQKEYVETDVHRDFLGYKTGSVCESTSESIGTLSSGAFIADRATSTVEASDEDSSETLWIHNVEGLNLGGKNHIPEIQLINNVYSGCECVSGSFSIDLTIDTDPICLHFINSADVLGI
ncbi:hypothetical protein AYI70_g8561 [Smittium culicis]|uniref:Uncharacterized protein n=2 Tax=Smittium culicis TaxID=133412 RepID=A0A1R1XFC4_9FUNG|nr:hypothetical protein AYI70_g8561 [Smittium culicis]